jgi:hypothetical protein
MNMSRVWGNLRAVCWKNIQKVYALFNMHIPHAEGNLMDGRKAAKPLIIGDYTTHMDYDNMSSKKVNSCSISKKA